MSEPEPWTPALQARLSALGEWMLSESNAAGNIRISLASSEDAAIVLRITKAAFAEYQGVLQPPSGAETETVEDVRRAIQEGGALLGFAEGIPIAAARFRLFPEHLYVGRLAVLPAYRGRGIASAILGVMEEIARVLDRSEIHLGTRMRLPRNLALYQKLGYDIVRVQPHPRGPDQIAHLVKKLNGSSVT